MCVYHHVMLCGLCDGVEIMVVQPLSVMMLSERQYITDISALDGVVTIFVHKTVCGLHMTFIVSDRGRCLVVHKQFDTF